MLFGCALWLCFLVLIFGCPFEVCLQCVLQCLLLWFGCGLAVVLVWFGCGLGVVLLWFGCGLAVVWLVFCGLLWFAVVCYNL